jgi:hypothetical protein
MMTQYLHPFMMAPFFTGRRYTSVSGITGPAYLNPSQGGKLAMYVSVSCKENLSIAYYKELSAAQPWCYSERQG